MKEEVMSNQWSVIKSAIGMLHGVAKTIVDRMAQARVIPEQEVI
jgi:hypothetical protein